MTRTALFAVLGLAAAGCASTGEPTQVAAADCRVVPITTASAAGRAPRVDPIEQRFAEMQLANSGYRQAQLAQRGLHANAVEDALRDCNRR